MAQQPEEARTWQALPALSSPACSGSTPGEGGGGEKKNGMTAAAGKKKEERRKQANRLIIYL